MLRFNRILLSAFALGSALSVPLAAQGSWDLLGTQKVSMARETDVIDVTRRDGRYDALRIEVDGGPIEIYNIRVEFANGENFSPPTRVSLSETDRTQVIDLPGASRDIQRIVFRYRGPLRLGSATMRVYGRRGQEVQVAPTPARPAVRAPEREGWMELGSSEVDFRTDRDVIQVAGERRFNTILFAVEGADVEISRVRVNFANGEHFDPDLRLVFQENSRSRFIDLPGLARDIRNIEFRYRTLHRNNVNHKAIVHVYGKTRTDGRSPAEEGWIQIGARQVDFRTDRDVIPSETNQRFTTILLAVEGADVEISNVRVNFANGQRFTPEVRLVFEANSRSRFIELPGGEPRDIRNIEFRYRTLRQGSVNDKAIVHVYGRMQNGSR